MFIQASETVAIVSILLLGIFSLIKNETTDLKTKAIILQKEQPLAKNSTASMKKETGASNLEIVLFKRELSLQNFDNPVCDVYYLQHKHLYDTKDTRIFSDTDLRDKLFPNFKSVYPSIGNGDCILDIGSNIGEISEMFHKYYPENRIYLAEPLELNCETTAKKYNSISQIQTIHTAIGYKRKTTKKWRYKNAGDMMGLGRILRKEEVNFMSLDNFYKRYVINGNVFLLKIDVEGYEDEVLFSGKKLLSENKIRYIYFEYHRIYNLICKTRCTSLVVYLDKLGYHCYLVGKFKMIRITKGCFMSIDYQKLAHVVGIKDEIEMENKFVNNYNRLKK